MTKKDYELIARIIRAQWVKANHSISPDAHFGAIAGFVRDITIALEENNRRFNRDKFLLEACDPIVPLLRDEDFAQD